MDDAAEFEAQYLMSQTSDHEMLRNLLFESLSREKELTRAMNEQIIENDKLRMELDIEKKKG